MHFIPTPLPLLPRAAPRRGKRAPRALLVVLALLGSGAALGDGPSVGELVTVCERALAQGNRGLDAAMCEWFAAPCACKVSRSDQSAEPWCVPEGESIDNTVAKVVRELREYPDRSATVDRVVPALLAELYPCPTPN